MTWAALVAGLALAGPAAHAFERGGAYPEGPLVADRQIFVAEMRADRVAVFDADGAWRTFWGRPGCGPTSIAVYKEGYAITCHIGRGVALVDRTGADLRFIKDETGGQPNDSSADSSGGVYLSSPGLFTSAVRIEGAILRLTPEGRLERVAEGLWYPNGVFFDAAEQALYVSEHLARKIWRYPVREDGGLGARALFADIDAIAPPATAPLYAEAGPDGLERAPGGDLVVALYGEQRLLQIASNGALRRTIPVPMRFVTNIAFLPEGDAIVVGAHDNTGPGLAGEIIVLRAETFAP